MKVVIDTNILIRGDLGPYAAAVKILQAVIDKKIQAYISPPIKKEYQLKVKELLNDQKYIELLDQYLETCELMIPQERLGIIKEDPEDNKFLDLAYAVKADFLISEDHHLLDLGEYLGIEIIKPQDFINKLTDHLDQDGQGQWQSWIKDLLQT